MLLCSALGSGDYSFVCMGFSLWWLLLFWSWVLGVRASLAVVHGPSNHSPWAYLLRGIWNLPKPGIEPASPALAGGFLSTVPPAKSCYVFLVSFTMRLKTEWQLVFL